MIAHVLHEGTANAPTSPGGIWSLLSGPHVIETTIARHWVYGAIAAGTEDGTTVNFGTAGGTNQRGGRIYSFSGRLSGSIDQLVRNFSHQSHATDPQMPTVKTIRAGALAVALVMQNDNNALAAATGESGGDWTEAVAEYVAALTPGLVLQLQTATPTGNPGTISGGAVAATNDPSGVIGFALYDSRPTKDLTNAAMADAAQALTVKKTIAARTPATVATAAQVLGVHKVLQDETANNRDGQAYGDVVGGQVSPIVPPRNFRDRVMALGPAVFIEDQTVDITPRTSAPFSRVSIAGYNPYSGTRTFGGWAKARSRTGGRGLFSSDGTGVIPSCSLPDGTDDVTFTPAVFGAQCTWTDAWPDIDVWVLWGLTFRDASDEALLYINGELVSLQAVASTWGGTNNGLAFGGRGGGNLGWDGLMHGSFCLEGEVTAAQWRSLYNGSVGWNISPASTSEGAQGLVQVKKALLTPAAVADGAQALTAKQLTNLAPAAVSEAAQPLDYELLAPAYDLTPATVADGAQALSAQKRASLAPAGVNDAAQALTIRKLVQLVVAQVVAEAQPFTSRQLASLTPAQVADSAQALTAKQLLGITAVSESTVAQALSKQKRVALTPASIADGALPMVHVKYTTIAPADMFDSAQALEHLKRVTLGHADVTDFAVQLDLNFGPNVFTIQPATVEEAAQALTAKQLVSLAPAASVTAAQALSLAKRQGLTPATVQADAQALTSRQLVALTPAQVDAAVVALTLRKRVNLVAAMETTQAMNLVLSGGTFVSIVPAVINDVVVALVVVHFENDYSGSGPGSYGGSGSSEYAGVGSSGYPGAGGDTYVEEADVSPRTATYG